MVKAQVGDLIRIVNASDYKKNRYTNGDIFEVNRRFGRDDGVWTTSNIDLYDYEYEIFRKAGEEDSEEQAPTCKHCGKSGVHTCRGPQDAVNHPNHYTQGRFETIEVIEEITQNYKDGYVAYCVGNALKYIARAPFKHESPLEDLRKAAKYIEFAIERLTQSER